MFGACLIFVFYFPSIMGIIAASDRLILEIGSQRAEKMIMDKQPLSERDPLPEEFSVRAETDPLGKTHSTAEHEDGREGELQSAWEAKQYLLHRARRGDWNRFQAILDKVPNNEPDEEDRL